MATPNQPMNLVEMVKLKMMMGTGGDTTSMYTIIIMMMISFLETRGEQLFKWAKRLVDDKYEKVVTHYVEQATNDKYSIYLEKDLSKQDNNDDTIVESVLYNISDTYNLKSVMYFKNLYIVNFFEQFQIDTDIYGKLHKIDYDKDNNISQIKIQISSDTLVVTDLRKFIEKCHNTYKRKIQNNLGSDLCFFDQMPVKNAKFLDSSQVNAPFVTFECNKFLSNRNFSNVFGDNIDTLKKRVTFFKENKSWYDKKGIPYTFGALLYGPPGTGKTSIIKAIANECKRHIININLAEIKTNTQLKNLFYNEKVYCKNELQGIQFDIQIHEKLFIIEDIDCMSNIVMDRKIQTHLPEEVQDITCIECKLGHHEMHCYNVIKKFCPHCETINKRVSQCLTCKNPKQHCDQNDHCQGNFDRVRKNARRCVFCQNKFDILELQTINPQSNFSNYPNNDTREENIETDSVTLSSLLNILDGTLELPGRMIIITSNFPEQLDKALIRPGRIDLIINLDRASSNTIQDMYHSFYSEELSQSDKTRLESIDKKWTPAEVNCILFNNFYSPESSLDQLLNLQPDALTKFVK